MQRIFLKNTFSKNSTSNYAVLYIASEKIIDLVDQIDDLRQTCLSDKKGFNSRSKYNGSFFRYHSGWASLSET